MKNISTLDVIKLSDTGVHLIIKGCGGDLNEWVDGINELLRDDGILTGNIDEVYKYQSENGITNLIFAIDGSTVNIGKLAMWRLANRQRFGAMWLDDYVSNYIKTEYDEDDDEDNF